MGGAMRSARAWLAFAVGLLAAVVAAPAVAGPPYVTDDPVPTDTGHWEIYAYTSGTRVAGETAGEGGLDINYGGAKDLQLTVVLPLEYDQTSSFRGGPGDVELGAKYRFIHQDEKGWLPDVSLFPHVDLPTSSKAFGNGRASVFLPVWAEKDFGRWSTFGGGGYAINPGPGNRNYWLTGWALTRKINDRLTLGGEIYHQTPDAVGQKSTTGVGAGLTYQLVEHFAFIASGGPALQNPTGAQQGSYYAGILFTY